MVEELQNFKVLDLFSGCGGFSYGMEYNTNFKSVIAVDIDKDALTTYRNNLGSDILTIQGDLTDSTIRSHIIDMAREKGVNMVIGGPPCQGFSLKGKNLGLKDKRNYLFLEYYNIVKELRPKIFIIENVKNITKSGNGYFLKEIYNLFSELGYHINHKVLNAKNFYVPQNRERAFIIGSFNKAFINLPKQELDDYITVRDAISDLSYLNSGEGKLVDNYKYPAITDYQNIIRNNMPYLHNHVATNHSKLAIEKLSLIPEEGDKSFLPKEYHGKQKIKTTWSRLIWDKVSPTIDTRFDTPSNGRNSHPKLNRAITPREAARLQSFPDSFIFFGNKTSICRQIGNAVPPLLAKAIAEEISKGLVHD